MLTQCSVHRLALLYCKRAARTQVRSSTTFAVGRCQIDRGRRSRRCASGLPLVGLGQVRILRLAPEKIFVALDGMIERVALTFYLPDVICK